MNEIAYGEAMQGYGRYRRRDIDDLKRDFFRRRTDDEEPSDIKPKDNEKHKARMEINGRKIMSKKLEEMMHEYICPVHGKIKTLTEGCYLCRKDQERKAQELQAERNRLEIQKRNLEIALADAYVPEIFWGCTMENYSVESTEHRAMAQKAKMLIGDTYRTLTFIGKTGTGKTRLCCSILAEMIARGKKVLYTTEQQISSKLKSAWDRKGRLTEEDVIAYYTAPDVLVIDEIRGTAWTQGEGLIMAAIIDGRWQSLRKKTVLAGNVSPEQMKQHFEDRTLSRLADHGCVYACVGEDQRRI